MLYRSRLASWAYRVAHSFRLLKFSLQDPGRVAFAGLDYGFGRALAHEVAAATSAFGSEVDEIVGCFHHVGIVLHDDYGVAALNEGRETVQKGGDVVEVKACGGFVEDEHRGPVLLTRQIGGQLDALALTSR